MGGGDVKGIYSQLTLTVEGKMSGIYYEGSINRTWKIIFGKVNMAHEKGFMFDKSARVF